MTSTANEVCKARDLRSSQGEQPHWVLIAGGALLSSLSIHLGYKLKQALDSRQRNQGRDSTHNRRRGNCQLRSHDYFTRDEDIHFGYDSENEDFVGGKQAHNGHMTAECGGGLPLVTVTAPGYGKQTGVMWASSPDRLELPPKPLHNSNSSFSPSVSESGSDVFSKRERREVIHKLRQQLKRRDEMILEMQDQILELQNTLNSQISHSTHLQSQLDAMNQDLFDSEREIQRLRKAIANHCVRTVSSPSETVSAAPSVGMNGHTNGYHEHETILDPLEERSTSDRIEMLRREVGELKEVIDAKDYLLQSYKEQKSEMSGKITELQLRLDCQHSSIM